MAFIPVFNNTQYVNDSGFLTSDSQIYNDKLNQSLQNCLSDNGWTFPQISAANLVLIAPKMPDGTGWYEKDNQVMVFKIGGALRKLTTTAYP